MVFKKPYAFFIKYFKLINLILCLLIMFFIYKLNLLHKVLNNIYFGRLTNFINLESTYIGFVMYLLIFLVSIIILIIILTLRKKQKPFRDYLYNIIYNIIIIAYFFSVSNLFLELNSKVIEQTTLKLYSDISLLIILPIIYFLIKYILIVIGFSINKFNFQKDIIELKKAEEDNEEIELIFNKNSYKTKRKIRRTFRELKYYIKENKVILGIILFIILLSSLGCLFGLKLLNKDIVNVGERFVAGNFSYKVIDIYETKYDVKYNVIKNDYKFVIVNVEVRNNLNLGESIDFKRIRLFYGNEYVYSNNYYNDYLYDFNPYDGQIIKSGENIKYSFIFKVPVSFNSYNYTLKFYDRILSDDNEFYGNYKTIKVNSKNLDKKVDKINSKINENIFLDKSLYGNSNLTIYKYSLENSYTYNHGDDVKVIRDSNINNILLILDYNFIIDNVSNASMYIKSDKDFFDSHVSLEYVINGSSKFFDNVNVIDLVDKKVFIGVPYNLKSADSIKLNINFRNKKIIYSLK